MARLSLIQRNLKRERLVKKYSKKRIALKKIIKNKKTSPEVRIDAINKLSKYIISSSWLPFMTSTFNDFILSSLFGT